jgi:hypothetical protein
MLVLSLSMSTSVLALVVRVVIGKTRLLRRGRLLPGEASPQRYLHGPPLQLLILISMAY